jgi:hypothetical protein
MVCKKVNAGIDEYLAERGIDNVASLVGSLRTGKETADVAISG